jgi:catechol 2,3-dioxygenase-like lactoylglutathione lyase family enzyme
MTKLPEIKKTNTILYCERWRETISFYHDKLGLKKTYQCDWLVEFRLTSFSYLSVANQKRTTISSADGRGITLSFEIDNIEKAHRKMAVEGLSPTSIRSQVLGADVFYVFDPEGTRIEFWSSE